MCVCVVALKVHMSTCTDLCVVTTCFKGSIGLYVQV